MGHVGEAGEVKRRPTASPSIARNWSPEPKRQDGVPGHVPQTQRKTPTSSAQNTCQRSMPAANGHVGTQSLSCKPGGAMGMCDVATDTDTAKDLRHPRVSYPPSGAGIVPSHGGGTPGSDRCSQTSSSALPCDRTLTFTGKLNTHGAQGRRVG